MSITFRIATADDDEARPTAIITARQLAAFRRFLRTEGERTGTALLDPDADDDVFLSYRFEARICPLALAAIARLFDYATDVISVVEEAQFRGRRVSVFRDQGPGTINLAVALTSDLGLELNLASNNAFALLDSLGLDAASVGETTIKTIRDRLASPDVRRHAAEHGIADYIERLDRLVAVVANDESCRLEWA